MGFFGGEDARGEPEDAGDQEGISVVARERLGDLGQLFTSNLSVNEFALLEGMGPKPLAQVMGSSVVRVGWQYLPALPAALAVPLVNPRYGPTATGAQLTNRYAEASRSTVRDYVWHQELVCELDVLSEAWNLARRQALQRLVDEAQHVGASSVVGIRLQREDHDLGAGTIEFVVTGTAIAEGRSDAPATPILTDLSVQDYWRLRRAGHEPVGLLASTAVVFASPSRSTRLRRMRSTPQNQELEELSRGFHAARAAIRTQLRGQLTDARGTGAVGVEISHTVRHEKLALASSLGSPSRRGWNTSKLGLPYYVSGRTETERRGWVITMHGAGTAINYRPRSQPSTKTQIRIGGR